MRRRFFLEASLLLAGVLLPACVSQRNRFQSREKDESGKLTLGSIVEVEFMGADSAAAHLLARAIAEQMFELSKRPLLEEAAFDAALELEDFYKSEGFADVSIRHKLLPLPLEGGKKGTLVRFQVYEGPRVTVSELVLEGNKAFTDAELEKLWIREHRGFLGLGRALFVESFVRHFAESIREFYRKQGYLLVKVDGPDIERKEGANSVRIEIRITEDKRFKIGGAEVAASIRTALAGQLPKAPVSEWASPNATLRYADRIVLLLRRLGYPDPQIQVGRVRPPKGKNSNTLTILIEGSPGQKRRIVAIEVEGNERVSTAMILAKFKTKKGEVFSGDDEDQAIAALERTGLFRKVRIVHEAIQDDGLLLRIIVTERKRLPVEFLSGYSSWERVTGGVQLHTEDFLGSGFDLASKSVLSTKGWTNSLELVDRDLIGSGLSLSASGEIFRRVHPSFTDKGAGGRIKLSAPLDKPFRIGFGYGFLDRHGSHVQAVDPFASLENFEVATALLDLELDRLDSKVSPREGFLFRVEGELANEELGSDIDFRRLRLDGVKFLPLSKSSRMVFHAKTGLIWGNGNRLPVQERFFAGGASSVRSFREAKLGPKDARGEALGGEYANLFSIEYRTSISSQFEAVLFGDAGNIGSLVHDYGFSKMRYAIGAGVILMTPANPARFDAAFNPDRSSGEEEWVLHLRIGVGLLGF